METTIEKWFHLKERGTSVRTELIAGMTTFVTVAYILAVNPSVLSAAGLDSGAVFTASALASFIGTCMMALTTNYPFILAPGLGLNAYFAYTVVLGMGYSWQTALAAVFVEGVVFLLLSLTKLRDMVINAIPSSLKLAITAGIGLFIALIGLKGAGVVVSNPATLVSMLNFHTSFAEGTFSTAGISAILALVGVLVMAVLMAKGVKGSILLGILITWGLGLICQFAGVYVPQPDAGFASLIPDFSQGISIPSLSPILLKFDFSHIGEVGFLTVVFAILFTSLFDTIGTVLGLASKADLLESDGSLRKAKGALATQSLVTMLSAAFGISPTCVPVECAAGITEGGRTGFSSLVAAVLFLLSLLLSPFFLAIPLFATAPALVVVGFSMMGALFGVNFNDITEGIPAFLCVIAMPFTYSIAEGMYLGVISYVAVNFFCDSEKRKKISPMMYVLALAFLIKYILI